VGSGQPGEGDEPTFDHIEVNVRKPTRGPGKRLRKWERAELTSEWFIGKRGQKVDVSRNARGAAESTGMRQAIHTHRADERCGGIWWPDEDGLVQDGRCWVEKGRRTVQEATGATERAQP
jgi:hypothetical protein